MEDIQRYSLSYRTAEARKVMNWIRAGQCGCIIGLRGSGKSNFIRFLLRTDTQQYYLGQAKFTFVLINLLSLTEHSEWGVYEMILNNLLAQLHPSDITNETILELRTSHQEIMRVRDVLIAEQTVERCMALVCQQPTLQLVLLFDEFDAVFRDLPASLFRCLRAIRDLHKDQISYTIVAKHELASLRDDLAQEVDHFHRLISRNLCWLGPYSETDARQMIGYLASRRTLAVNEKDSMHLFELSGGHAGLLKTILSLLWSEDNPIELKKLAPTLAKSSVIEGECQKIWGSLSKNEKIALCSFFNGDLLDELTLNHLIERRLIYQDKGGGWVIFSSLFTLFVQHQAPPPSKKGTCINRSPQVVQLAGERIENLTELEFELLYYLYEHRGRIRTKNDLVENIYRQRYVDLQGGVTDESLQALISRLRKKIEPDPGHPCYIVTVRGEGYKFVLPDE